MGWEKPKLPALQQKEILAQEAAAATPKKRKGPKGQNPLSCLKPKKKTQPPQQVLKQPPSAIIPDAAPKKRQRSRRMGTRTKEEAERLAHNKENDDKPNLTESSRHA